MWRIRERYLHGLVTVIGQTAAAYGYTLMTWSTGAILIHFHGPPTPGEVALFLVGAVASFGLVEAVATRGSSDDSSDTAPSRALWLTGALNAFSAGGAIACAYGLSLAIGIPHLVWPLTAFVASTVYFLLVGLQVALAEARTS